MPAIFLAQKFALVLSYQFHRLIGYGRRRAPINWVVGVDEIASMVTQISAALPHSYSVSFAPHPAYDFSYDYGYRRGASRRARALRKLLIGPILLGRLMSRSRGVLYVGASGFLMNQFDQRDFEFAFLKKKGVRLAIYWCGSEIRSTRKMHELEKRMGLPNISTYIGLVSPYFETEAHERVQRQRASVADAHADVMFDFPTDQSSYLTRHREPSFYLIPDDRVRDVSSKFDDLSRLVVTHASTSPMIKGTPLVRAAVGKLRAEGYDFDYVELIGVSNDELLAELARSHIALNQFYGFTTTVFGVEAMAAQCALMSSSDGDIETNLPPQANGALMLTKHWQVYDNLKALLDHPERTRQIAMAGQEWVRRYATASSSGPRLASILDLVLAGTYDSETRRSLSTAEVYAASTPDSGGSH